jgi:hypothetical protein
MNKRKWLLIISVLVVGGLWASKHFSKKSDSKQKSSITQLDSKSYWTCPMHPQIHLDHSGECPICHMKLVQVQEQAQMQEADQTEGEKRSSVQVSQSQSQLLGIQKYQVEKMDLKAKIPVSGRILSSSSVAFQIYEDDLRYVHSGLSFTGESSTYSEDEISGMISSVDSIVDPTSRTVRVVGSIRKGAKNLRSETGFRGEIEIDLKDRIAIPESSVLHTGNGDLVYIFTDGNKLKAQKVKLGLKAEGFYEVVEGLKPDDNISSGPNFLIDSEAKIRGASDGSSGNKNPECPSDQHWDIPMAMCMPGKAAK